MSSHQKLEQQLPAGAVFSSENNPGWCNDQIGRASVPAYYFGLNPLAAGTEARALRLLCRGHLVDFDLSYFLL